LLFVTFVVIPTGGLAGDAKLVLAVVLWMAVWWVTEAAPLALTSLLPLVLFPLLGVRGVRDVAPNYSDHMIFLFFGGFVLALAVQRSGLHRRLALAILDTLGSSPRRQMWGFLVATAVLSMWLSNTATTLMMLPIAAGVVDRIGDRTAGTRLFLAVAYGASVGGVGTLVGTPPNLVLAGMAPNLVEGIEAIGFGRWMLFGVPFVAVMLPAVGLLLGRGLSRTAATGDAVGAERRALGRMTSPERRVAVLFAITAAAWIMRSGMDFGVIHVPGWDRLLPDPRAASDAVPAVAAAIACALLPSGEAGGRRLLHWDEIRHGVPWGVLLLFGGGFALADGVRVSGLGGWLADSLAVLGGLPLPLVVLSLCLFATTATELTSNTATATLLMPILAALSEVLGVHAYLLMVPAIVSCSCAFMLPVATPPNAIVMGSGHVSARDLFREGLRLNLIGAVVITALTLTLGRLVLPLG
jgi:sodium-dependent dicarboxylate transporter 2/3/5